MISVCLATYNGEKYIKRQLASILTQIETCDEVVISDDGSKDRTVEIVNSFRDSRIKVIHNSNHGAINNFENALNNANGNYIFLSDQDDEWLPNKVQVCLNYLRDYDCVISDNIVVDENGKTISESFFTMNKMHTGRYYNLLVRNNYIGCCMAFNRRVLDKVLPFPKNIPMHDIWIGNIAAFTCRTCFIPEKLIKFYRHQGNSSTTGKKSELTFLEQLRNRWTVVCYLFNSRK